MGIDRVETVDGKDGARLRLRVKPGARRSRLVGPHGGALKVEVAAPPEKGKANAALVKLLARELGVGRGAVEITSGVASQDKRAQIHGVTATELSNTLKRLGIGSHCGSTRREEGD